MVLAVNEDTKGDESRLLIRNHGHSEGAQTALTFSAQHDVIPVAIAIPGNIFCGQWLFLCANEMDIFLQ